MDDNRIMENQWWVKKLEAFFANSMHPNDHDDTRRAVNIALKNIREQFWSIRPGDILPATAERPECVVVPVEAMRLLSAALEECNDAAVYEPARALVQSLRKDHP